MAYSLNPSTNNCYEGTTCLINKFGIRDEEKLAEIEAQITFAKAAILEKNPKSPGKRIAAIFITQNGSPKEYILGMLTPWDIIGGE